MDCILYIDLFFLWNFWMNALVLFLVRQITRTYRTLQCLLSAFFGAFGACLGVIMFLFHGSDLIILVLELGIIVVMNLLAFGGKNILWHIVLFCVAGAVSGGILLFISSAINLKSDSLSALVVSVVAFLLCALLEKKSRIRWKEEHMKAKTVLELGDRRLFATALMDTGNKLYDPIFHKPVTGLWTEPDCAGSACL